MNPRQPPSATPTPPLLLLFGAGRHGRVVADAALLENSWERIVASDRDPAACQQALLPGVEILELEFALGLHSEIHVAIGHYLSREREGIFLGIDRLALGATAHLHEFLLQALDLAFDLHVLSHVVRVALVAHGRLEHGHFFRLDAAGENAVQ